MADVGASTVSDTPNADSMQVNPILEPLAANLIQAEGYRMQGDFTDCQANLQAFWNGVQQLDPTTASTYQSDLVKLDAYSHRILGFVYLTQMGNQSDPTQIPVIGSEAAAQFTQSVAEFTACNLTQQAADDQNVLSQINGWTAQDQSAWIDTSYVAALKSTIASDVQAAGNLLSGATSSLLGAIPMSWWLIAGAAVAVLFLWKKK